MPDMETNTLQQIGADAEAAAELKDKDPVFIFMQLSKKIDQVLVVQRQMQNTMEEMRRSLFDPDYGVVGRVKNIEEWKKDLTNAIDTKIIHCKESCVIENGKIRLDRVEKTVEQIKKFQWLIISVISTGVLGYILKVVFPIAQAAAQSL